MSNNYGGVSLTCECGHTGDFDTFINTATGELPPGHYQCPACHRAWKIEKTPITIFKGRLISEPNKIVPTQSQL